MKTHRLLIVAGALTLGAALVPSAEKPARATEEPAKSAAPQGEASLADAGDLDAADLDAGDAGDASADAGPPAFDAVAFSDERSKRPKAAEWKTADRVSLGNAIPSNCDAHRVREWLRIHCSDTNTLGIRLLGGEDRDVAFDLDPVKDDDFPPLAGGVLVFAVRRGDRRVFEWLSAAGGYKGNFSAIPILTLEESWLPDEASPVIL